MLFNTPLFFGFICIFFILYSFVFTQAFSRAVFVLVSSLIFYAGWDFRFIPLLLFSGVVDFFVANGLDSAKDQARKKYLLTISIATNLGILAIFKYTNFMVDSVQDTLTFFGADVSLGSLDIVLPVGISFYTFQSMSYTIDVYRGETHARKNFLPFITTLSFFPQLVAGPILRARQILPQIERFPTPTIDDVKYGFVLITMGLFKKNIADLLAFPAQSLFGGSEPLSWLEAVTGVVAFAGQIYGDFSGYSDIAIGLALIIGIKVPLNFKTPYFAVSPVDFWDRWHISLSGWLRDYLYISLGGNRTGHKIRNIYITMLLGGLWHGAAWTFVVWGAYHGTIIAATHKIRETKIGQYFKSKSFKLVTLVLWVFTFYLICIGWVFFRANSIGDALSIIAFLHVPDLSIVSAPFAGVIFSLVVVTIFFIHGIDYSIIRFREGILKRFWLVIPLLIIGQTFVILIGEPGYEFIYFQF